MNWASPYIIAIVAAWVIAHIIKYAIDLARREPKAKTEKVFRSGGMPSAHAATATALAVVIFAKDGWSSPVFALAMLFLLIISHDAVRVRRASGEQGVALGLLIDETKSKIPHPRAPKGHTSFEVGVGWVLGILVGAIVAWLF